VALARQSGESLGLVLGEVQSPDDGSVDFVLDSVAKGGLAAKAGLRSDDIIVAIGDESSRGLTHGGVVSRLSELTEGALTVERW
jgi:C-terminal processing protease CtpA/Prc